MDSYTDLHLQSHIRDAILLEGSSVLPGYQVPHRYVPGWLHPVSWNSFNSDDFTG
jgi:hypothetical protein